MLQAQEEVENGLIGFEKSRQRLDKVALAVVAAEESEKIALGQYEAGTADFHRVFAIQSAKFGQQDEAARLQGIVARRWINTYRALGGGWQFNFDHALSAAVQPIP